MSPSTADTTPGGGDSGSSKPRVIERGAGFAAEKKSAARVRAVGAWAHFLQQDGVLFALTAQALARVNSNVAGGSPPDLETLGQRIGSVPDVASLPRKFVINAAAPQPAARKGRAPTTGRFKSREQLLDKIWFLRKHTDMTDPAIAANVRLSPTAVTRILRSGEGEPQAPALEQATKPAVAPRLG